MNKQEEIATAVFGTFSEISRIEKEKALQNKNYGDAIAASVFEGVFKTIVIQVSRES